MKNNPDRIPCPCCKGTMYWDCVEQFYYCDCDGDPSEVATAQVEVV